MGKGDTRRPAAVPEEHIQAEWERLFLGTGPAARTSASNSGMGNTPTTPAVEDATGTP